MQYCYSSIKLLVDRSLKSSLPRAVGKNRLKPLYKAIRYSVLNGGKRLRPVLCIGSYLLFRRDIQRILPVACSLELIHNFSLIHDDLPSMDNDDWRRGHPTCHKVFGEDIALLAGDYLLNLAYIWIMDTGGISLEDKFKVLSVINRAIGEDGLIGGQVLDLRSSEGQNPQNILELYRRKTGALFRACITTGAILGNADNRMKRILEDFGNLFGLTFQLIDDLSDLEADQGKDILSYPKLVGVERTVKKIRRLTTRLYHLLDHPSLMRAKLLREIVDRICLQYHSG